MKVAEEKLDEYILEQIATEQYHKVRHIDEQYGYVVDQEIANTENEVTHADLTEALPFYKSGTAARNEMLSLAIAWGYKNHIIIKKSFVDGIEFFKGETLKQTDLNKICQQHHFHHTHHQHWIQNSWHIQ